MPDAVYVMLYHHRHGVDFSVYEVEADAWAATRNIIDACLGEYQSPDNAATVAKVRELLDNPNAGDSADENVYTLWAELSEESFEIEKRGIVPRRASNTSKP